MTNSPRCLPARSTSSGLTPPALITGSGASATAPSKGLIDRLSLQRQLPAPARWPVRSRRACKGHHKLAAENGDAKPSGTPDPHTQLTSNGQGQTDIGDFQYGAFNLVALTFLLVHFIPKVSAGLPTMPDSLVGLTSVSALIYVGKKGRRASDA